MPLALIAEDPETAFVSVRDQIVARLAAGLFVVDRDRRVLGVSMVRSSRDDRDAALVRQVEVLDSRRLGERTRRTPSAERCVHTDEPALLHDRVVRLEDDE